MKPKFLIIGAAGNTGSATALELLEKGYSVRAFVRKADHRSEKLHQKGAEICVGSLTNLADVENALKGIQSAYFVAPWEKEQLQMAMTFVVAAKNSTQLNSIVALTQWLASPEHPSQATRESYLTDQIFSLLPNIHHTTINTGWFAQNYMSNEILTIVTQLGMFPFPLGSGKTAPVSNEDIARVVTACLLSPKEHSGKTYRPTGPELLSPEDIATTFSTILQRNVKYDNISEKLFLKALNLMGMSPHMQCQLQHYIKDYQTGAFEKGAPNTIVEQITGRKAENFETIARRYLDNFELTEANLSNKTQALIGFIKLLLSPATNLEKYALSQGQSTPSSSRYAMASEKWLQQH